MELDWDTIRIYFLIATVHLDSVFFTDPQVTLRVPVLHLRCSSATVVVLLTAVVQPGAGGIQTVAARFLLTSR
jgi:hypothetical protein